MSDLHKRADEVTQEDGRLFVKIDCRQVARIDKGGERHALDETKRGYELLDCEVYQIDFQQERAYYVAGQEIDKDKISVYLRLVGSRSN